MKRIACLVVLSVVILVPACASSGADSMTAVMTRLVLQLAVVMVAVRFFGHVFSRYLKQSRVLGELISGMVIGPYALGGFRIPFLGTPLFPLQEGTLPVSPELYGFAVVASIVLLFMAGLETDLPTFLKFSAVGTAVGAGGVVVAFVLGDLSAVLLLPGVDSYMHPTALFLGTLSTATSVGITARILSEKRKMSSPEGVTILAAAVLDDVIGIILLAVVVGIAKAASATGPGAAGVSWGSIGIIALKAFGFWIGCTGLGILIAPKLSKGLKRFQSMEIIAGVSVGIALLLAGLSEMAGLAMIIGAYVTGLSLSQTDMAHELRENLQGVYHFLVPVFFCIMGMLVNFPAMKGVVVFGLIYTAVAIFSKIVGCGLPALMTGFNLRGALRIGTGMLPRGEVTLIVAGIGLSSGAIGSDMFGVAIMTLLIASVIAPPLIVKSFNGASGYTKKRAAVEPDVELKTIRLDFPSPRMAEFLRERILAAFRNEEFFIHRMDFHQPIFHLRKDEILITLVQKENAIIINTMPKHEPLVRFLVTEEVLVLKDFLQGIEDMQSPDSMGKDLLSGLF